MPHRNLEAVIMSWIGQGDFGDEVMAFVLRLLLRRFGLERVTYYHLGKEPTYRGAPGEDLPFSSLYSFDTKPWIKKWLDHLFLRKFHLAFSAGGSILHSTNSITWRNRVINDLKKRNPHFIGAASVGISIGPFVTVEEEQACAQFLDDNRLIITRDSYSANLGKSLSRNPAMFAALDLSLLLPGLCADAWQRATGTKREPELVGVMFIQKKGEEALFASHQFLSKYITLINRLTRAGKRVRLFNLYIGPVYPDIALNEKLRSAVERPDRVDSFSFDGDIFKTIAEMNRCSHIVSMRLHGIIFSYLLRIPFLSLAYNRKNEDFCREINYPTALSFDFYAQESLAPIEESLDRLLALDERVFDQTLSVAEGIQRIQSILVHLQTWIQRQPL